MNINIKSSLLGCLLLAGGLISCDQEEDVAEIISPADYPVATFEFISSDVPTVTNEGDETEYVYTVKIDKMLPRAVVVSARQVGGTADDHDYTISDAVIAPYTTEAQLTIRVVSDEEIEEDETAEFEIGAYELANKDLLNQNTDFPANLNLTIGNYLGDLEMTFDWGKEIVVNDTLSVFTCDSVDFDIFVANAEGFDINDPWATFNDAVMAATGDCPETMTFSGLPDGSYIIFAELWTNALSDDTLNVEMPITASFSRPGAFFDKIYIQDPSQVINSGIPGVDDEDYAGEVIDVYVAEVSILNGTYSVKGFDGDIVANGRVAGGVANKTPRPASTFVNK